MKMRRFLPALAVLALCSTWLGDARGQDRVGRLEALDSSLDRFSKQRKAQPGADARQAELQKQRAAQAQAQREAQRREAEAEKREQRMAERRRADKERQRQIERQQLADRAAESSGPVKTAAAAPPASVAPPAPQAAWASRAPDDGEWGAAYLD